MSKYKSYSDCAAFYDTTNRIQLDSHTSVSNSNQNAHHAFVADLDKLTTKITISFDMNGGTYICIIGVYNLVVPKGASVLLPKPSKDGYTFDYLEGSRYEANKEYVFEDNHNLKAIWIKKTDPVTPSYVAPKTGIE